MFSSWKQLVWDVLILKTSSFLIFDFKKSRLLRKRCETQDSCPFHVPPWRNFQQATDSLKIIFKS